LVQDLLSAMAQNQADFTLTFRGLLDGTAREQFVDPTAFDAWAEGWNAYKPDTSLMAQSNRRARACTSDLLRHLEPR